MTQITNQQEGEGVSSSKTYFIVVSDEASDEVVRETIRIKAKILDHATDINDIKVIRKSDISRAIINAIEEESNNAHSETRDNTAHLKMVDTVMQALNEEQQAK